MSIAKVTGFAISAFTAGASAQDTFEPEALLDMATRQAGEKGYLDAEYVQHEVATKAQYFQNLMAAMEGKLEKPRRTRGPRVKKVQKLKTTSPKVREDDWEWDDYGDYGDYGDEDEWIECDEDDSDPECQDDYGDYGDEDEDDKKGKKDKGKGKKDKDNKKKGDDEEGEPCDCDEDDPDCECAECPPCECDEDDPDCECPACPEEEVCEIEQVVNRDASPFDWSLDFLSDYTRSVKMKVGEDETAFNLVPDTNIDQIILLRDKCFGCYSLGDSHKYTSTCKKGITNDTVVTDIDFFYQLHAYQTTLNSTHFEEKACVHFENRFEKCANLEVLGADKSHPRALFLKGNGFLGLGVKETRVGDERRRLSALDQFHEKGIIGKRVFGIDTKLTNGTQIMSSIRFGEFNYDKIPATHALQFIDTSSSDGWELPLWKLDFHGEDILRGSSQALISPGFPFIAAPVDGFNKFKDSLQRAHPEKNLVCTRYDWCYFIDKCDNLYDIIDPLVFTLGNMYANATVSVPSKTFLIPDKDWNTNLTLCHLGVVGQKWHQDLDKWILGEDFMENNYVAFDASDPYKLKVGIASEVVPPEVKTNLKLIALIAAGVIGCLILSLGTWCCCRARKQRRAKEKLEFFQAQHRMNSENPGDSTTDLDGPNAHLNDMGGEDDDPDASNELRYQNI